VPNLFKWHSAIAWFCRTREYHSFVPASMWQGSRAWLSEPGEYYSSFSGELQGMWRRLGRPPQMLTGAGFTAQGFDRSIPYIRRAGTS
jgi:hypothetical protein